MTNANAKTFTLLSILALADLACDHERAEPSDYGSFREGTSGGHTLSGGGMWINNAFMYPAVGGFDPDSSLASPQGLATDHGLLLDPDTRDLARLMVACALPAGHTLTKEVDGEPPLVLEGELGLAPEWEDDACDEDCQEWVSACVMARTNVGSNDVSIWMRADHPAIGEATSPLYPRYEASFFGNLFADTQDLHYCHNDTALALSAQLAERTCDGSPETCEFIKHTNCQAQKRCNFPKNNSSGSTASDSPSNCIGGTIANGHAYHTITTYVGP